MDGSAPDPTLSATAWHAICAPDDILSNLGVAALVEAQVLAQRLPPQPLNLFSQLLRPNQLPPRKALPKLPQLTENLL